MLALLAPVLVGAQSVPAPAPSPAPTPALPGCSDTSDSLTLPQGAVSANIVVRAQHQLLAEVLSWMPSSRQARDVRMYVRWEAKAPATIDFGHGLIMFDNERLWNRYPYPKLPRGLTMELRVNRAGPWERDGAIQGRIKLQYGVRLAADWADVRAMARGADALYLVTRSRGMVVDTVELTKSDFEIPETELRAFLDRTRKAVTDPARKCYPDDGIVVT